MLVIFYILNEKITQTKLNGLQIYIICSILAQGDTHDHFDTTCFLFDIEEEQNTNSKYIVVNNEGRKKSS